MVSFLFVWQSFVYVPLSVASASIGFAGYARYLHPLSTLQAKAISGGLVLFLILLLYRRITTIGKISVLLWAGVVGTMVWLIWGGLSHFDAKLAFDFPPGVIPAIINPISSTEAVAASTIPMMRPSYITAILSARLRSSSNSAEISSIALPSRRAPSNSSHIASTAPTSSPRVGCCVCRRIPRSGR